MIERRLSSGVGRLVLARSKFAVTESFLPTGTSQYGPPTYNRSEKTGICINNSTNLYAEN